MTWHRGEGANGVGTWPELTVSMRVEHKLFGTGVVREVETARVTVDFPDPFGRKRLNLAFTELCILDSSPEQEMPAVVR